MSDALSLGFLPYYRVGLSANARAPERTLSMRIKVAGDTPHETTFQRKIALVQVGDLAGIDPEMIARVFPSPGSTDCPYDLFPFIEFRDPDFLWRYSYPSKGPPAPWLALVVLPHGEYLIEHPAPERSPSESPDGGSSIDRTPLLRLASGKTLDLGFISDSIHAWGHVQISGYSDAHTQDLVALRAGESNGNVFSRLLCPVNLEPDSRYGAFLVPLVATPDHIPVFHAWEFATSKTLGFLSLFERIEKRDVPSCRLWVTGPRHVDFGREGLPSTPAGTASLALGEDPRTVSAALGNESEAPGKSAEAPFPNEPLPADLLAPFHDKYLESARRLWGCASCRRVEEAGAVACGACGGPLIELDPYVGLPVYGAFHAEPPPLPEGGFLPGAEPWMYQLNISAAARIAAGLGAETVRRSQDELVDASWKAIASRKLAMADQRRRDVGEMLNQALYERHFSYRGGRATSGSHVRYQLSVAPSLRDDQTPAVVDSMGPVLQSRLADSGGSPAFRKLLHQKITARDRIVSTSDPRIDDHLQRCLGEHADSTRGARAVGGGRTDEPPHEFGVILSPEAQQASDAVANPGSAAALDGAVRDRWTSVRLRDRAMPRDVALELPYPAHQLLSALSPDYLLPNLDQLPLNSIAVLAVNQPFIESYLVGLNHELIRELIWREVPVRTDATAFHHFWDRDGASEGSDIRDITAWEPSSALGTHSGSAQAVRSVLLLKAEVLRVYHDMIIDVVQMTPDGVKRVPALFHCQLGDEVMLLGLPLDSKGLEAADAIFSEHPSLPRFGLSKATWKQVPTSDAYPGVTWVDSRRPVATGGPRLSWDDGALAAESMLRPPVQIHVRLAEFLNEKGEDPA